MFPQLGLIILYFAWLYVVRYKPRWYLVINYVSAVPHCAWSKLPYANEPYMVLPAQRASSQCWLLLPVRIMYPLSFSNVRLASLCILSTMMIRLLVGIGCYAPIWGLKHPIRRINIWASTSRSVRYLLNARKFGYVWPHCICHQPPILIQPMDDSSIAHRRVKAGVEHTKNLALLTTVNPIVVIGCYSGGTFPKILLHLCLEQNTTF